MSNYKYAAITILLLLFVVGGSLFLLSRRDNQSEGDNVAEFIENKEDTVSWFDISAESVPGLKVTDDEQKMIESECIQLSKLYKEIYQEAEKVPSRYLDADDDITQETIDEIEDILIMAGYPVINSDSVYPAYLENSDDVYTFWDSVESQKDDEMSFWGVSSSGGLYYKMFQFLDEKPYCIFAAACWNENDEMELTYIQKKEILRWDMTYNQDFYYQDTYLDRHWDASKLIRLHPVDQELYDLNLKYIMPIGYHNVNLFLLNWNADDYGDLCFNDLFDYLYRVENNDYFYGRDYPYYNDPYPHTAVPAELFEKTILPYFDITIDEFRQRALYDEESNTYPWQAIGCDNILYYPSLISEVTDYVAIDDSTIKLSVNVMCLDYQTDRLFVHEVTIRTLRNGKYQYIGNEITYTGDIEIPSAQARISAQRFSEEKSDGNY